MNIKIGNMVDFIYGGQMEGSGDYLGEVIGYNAKNFSYKVRWIEVKRSTGVWESMEGMIAEYGSERLVITWPDGLDRILEKL